MYSDLLVENAAVARTVYVVCTRDAYWPPETWAVFGSQEGARQHVERALWAFRVEPLPVYASYDECPPENRGASAGPDAIGKQAMLRLRNGGVLTGSDSTRDVATPPDWGASGGVVYAVRGPDDDGTGCVETQLFYESEEEARRHVDGGYYMSAVLPYVVYGTYAQCPAARRYDSPRGPVPSSQCMKPKRRSS